MIGATGAQVSELVPETPTAADLRQARTQRIFAVIEGEAGAAEARQGLRARVIVPIPAPAPLPVGGRLVAEWTRLPAARRARGRPAHRRASSPSSEARYLQLIQPVPSSIAANAEALQNGYRDYQELSLSRRTEDDLRTDADVDAAALGVRGDRLGSVLLASSMTAPLLQLAEGTRAVAEGNFKPVREYPGNDEMNLLTQSFNAMTRQLTEARDTVEVKQRDWRTPRPISNAYSPTCRPASSCLTTSSVW